MYELRIRLCSRERIWCFVASSTENSKHNTRNTQPNQCTHCTHSIQTWQETWTYCTVCMYDRHVPRQYHQTLAPCLLYLGEQRQSLANTVRHFHRTTLFPCVSYGIILFIHCVTWWRNMNPQPAWKAGTLFAWRAIASTVCCMFTCRISSFGLAGTMRVYPYQGKEEGKGG